MLGRIRKRSRTRNQITNDDSAHADSYEQIPKTVEAVQTRLSEIFSCCSDFIHREISCGKKRSIRILVAYINGFVDKRILNQDVIHPILDFISNTELHEGNRNIQQLKECIVINSDIKEVNDMGQAVDGILSGEALLFIDGENKALVIGVKAPQGRQVEEPDTEASIRGAKEGFVENLLTNMTLIRKRIKNPNLKMEMMQLESKQKPTSASAISKELPMRRLSGKCGKGLRKSKPMPFDTGIIEQYISDSRLSLFPTVGEQRKMRQAGRKATGGACSHILRWYALCPYGSVSFYRIHQTTDDYYDHAYFATFMRLLRLMALLVSNLLPAMYVALVSFHHTVIPFKLMITLAASRQGIPFSPFTEAILMIIAFELLREAGVRMPKPIGQALSIVGAIVLGEASVAAESLAT